MIELNIHKFNKTLKFNFKKIFLFIKEWSSAISAIAMVFSIVYVVYSTRENLKLVSQTISLSNEQLKFQIKSIPSQFTIDYENINDYSEQAFLINTGRTKLLNLIAEYEYYFISSDSLLLSSTNLMNYIIENYNIQESLRKSGLIQFPTDLIGLLGTSRKFNIAYLYPNERTLLDISSSSMQNAIRLNHIFKTQLFVRWKIKYNTELSNEQIVSNEYIWVNHHSLNKHIIINYGLREDLRNVLGGARIIKLIETYEAETNDILFK